MNSLGTHEEDVEEGRGRRWFPKRLRIVSKGGVADLNWA